MKSLHNKIITLSLLLFMGLNVESIAQEPSGSSWEARHTAPKSNAPKIPHGGMAKKASKYVIEMVVDFLQAEDKVTVYLLNVNAKTLKNKDVSGIVTYSYGDGTTMTDTLVSKGAHQMVSQLQRLDAFNAYVNLKVKGKDIGANFDHGGMKGHE